MEPGAEEQRIQLGTDSRKTLEQKYRLGEDSRYEEAKLFQREQTHQAAQDLKLAPTPQQFGQLIDERVIEPMSIRFGRETADTYGSRLKAAFLERMGEKARDEISLALSARNIPVTAEAQALIKTLPLHDSALSLASKLDSILKLPEMSVFGNRQQVFEIIRDAKVDEFEAFYEREKNKTNS